MFKWLRKQPEQPEIRDIKNQLKRVEDLLIQMAVTEKEPPIVIQHMHVDHPKLDQLTFKLDQIDIDEVSGALNIGTNSGIEISKPHAKSPSKSTPKSTKTPKKNPEKAEFSSTSSGFRFKR